MNSTGRYERKRQEKEVQKIAYEFENECEKHGTAMVTLTFTSLRNNGSGTTPKSIYGNIPLLSTVE